MMDAFLSWYADAMRGVHADGGTGYGWWGETPGAGRVRRPPNP
ncbi:hypothetical protein [Bifidobacterium castoris]|nr:hypothetical protein [Bifidobacterium castoris]